MEEDNTVKAPVTRLRRRLSVEQTEEKTSTPNTPTKKRTRQTKPQLDLIDENAATPQKSTPKRVTRKAIKDTLEPVEEKPITPVRRSARIKSNTSILSDSTVVPDSPRAKRSTRRNSQLGSDNEIPLTPVRQTRRTRKDSTTSLDRVDTTSKPNSPITETIVEESDDVPVKPVHKTPDSKSNGNNDTKEKNIDSETTTGNERVILERLHISPKQKENISPIKNRKSSLSESTIHLINNLKDVPPKTNSLNKSTSILETKKNKRTRSRSERSLRSESECSTKAEDQSDKMVNVSISKKEHKNTSKVLDRENSDINIKIDNSEKQNVSVEELFSKPPSDFSKPEIFIDEPDTIMKKDIDQDAEDQCVPIISVIPSPNKDILRSECSTNTGNSAINKSSEEVQNTSVEPMDVDQTITESLLANAKETNESLNCIDNQNSMKQSDSPVCNQSRKSIQDVNKTENKSTLILSQINPSENSSPLLSNNNSLTKSVVDLDKTQVHDVEHKNLTQTCLTSTPLQQKHFQKLCAPLNTSIIKSNEKGASSPKITGSETNSNQETISKHTDISNKINTNDKSLDNIKDVEKKKPKNKSHPTKIENVAEDSTENLSSKKPNSENKLKTNESESQNKAAKNNKKNDKKINDDSSDDMSENDSEVSSNNESKVKDRLLDEEASDAGEDYQSGDSQNEDDLEYAKENEIIDKGVTLTSEEELSDDTDYEKDSFVVSSDEEDYQLLEGTDDDLSLSDNELKMTAKSKKKYNDRMIKAQKKASREMFEARHKLKSKKGDKSVINDSDSSDSNDTPKPKKKSNRLRLDSSHEASTMDDSKTKVGKKSKKLSESTANESALNEKEITVAQNESMENVDPLCSSLIKETTPKSDLNSTVDFISVKANTEDVNETQNNSVQENSSQDPLEMSQDEETSSSDEETTNIMNNYDDVLNNLKKVKSNKAADISLNLGKKNKEKKKKASIIDELNLTEIKSTKTKRKSDLKDNAENKNQDKASESVTKKSKKDKPVKVEENDSSSDSIDLRLLWSEESDTEVNNTDKIIPLKESQAKTDVRAESDDEPDGSVNFFIDTKGDTDSPKQKFNNKNINNPKIYVTLPTPDKRAISISDIKESEDEMDVDETESDAPQEEKLIKERDDMPEVKTPKSDKKKRKSLTQMEETEGQEGEIEQNICKVKTPKSDKKQRKTSTQMEETEDQEVEIEHNISKVKTPKSDKKQRKTSTQMEETEDQEVEIEHNISKVKTPKSDKKQRKTSTQMEETEDQEVEIEHNISKVKTPKSDKKQRKTSTQMEETEDQEVEIEHNISKVKTPKSDKKQRKTSTQMEETEDQEVEIENNISKVKTPKSDKKQRKSSAQMEETEDQEVEIEQNISKVKTPKSDKKQRKTSAQMEETEDQEVEILQNISKVKTPKSDKEQRKLSMQIEEIEDSDAPQEEKIAREETHTVPDIKTPKTDKKKKKSKAKSDDKSAQQENDPLSNKTPKAKNNKHGANGDEISTNVVVNNSDSGKKAKKHKTQDIQENVEDQNEIKISKKKRKRSQTEQIEDIRSIVKTSESSLSKNKKQKLSDSSEENIPDADSIRGKKRKLRLEAQNIHKVQESSSSKSLPRLPMSIISQLDDKPTKKRPKVISTTEFSVQDLGKNKPSNFLEETVCLDEDSPKKKKPKKNIPKAKVLPSLPSCSTSIAGFTTNFKINTLPSETKFVAQATTTSGNFKEDRLYNKKIKRLGTYEMYKKHRNVKMSKF